MITLQSLCCALTYLLLFNYIQCRKPCDFTNAECMTMAAKQVYKLIVKGVDGQIESSDPLYYGNLEGAVKALTYKLDNATLRGLINCEATHLVGQPEKSAYEYFLRCPKLILSSPYELKGPFGEFQLNGKGTFTTISDDVVIEFRGEYALLIDEKDQTPRFHLKHVDIKSDTKGNIDIEITNLVDGDKEKSEEAGKFFHDNGRLIVDSFEKPIMDALLMKLINNHREYLKMYHIEELIPNKNS